MGQWGLKFGPLDTIVQCKDENIKAVATCTWSSRKDRKVGETRRKEGGHQEGEGVAKTMCVTVTTASMSESCENANSEKHK